jgi:hypothetical protein
MLVSYLSRAVNSILVSATLLVTQPSSECRNYVNSTSQETISLSFTRSAQSSVPLVLPRVPNLPLPKEDVLGCLRDSIGARIYSDPKNNAIIMFDSVRGANGDDFGYVVTKKGLKDLSAAQLNGESFTDSEEKKRWQLYLRFVNINNSNGFDDFINGVGCLEEHVSRDDLRYLYERKSELEKKATTIRPIIPHEDSVISIGQLTSERRDRKNSPSVLSCVYMICVPTKFGPDLAGEKRPAEKNLYVIRSKPAEKRENVLGKSRPWSHYWINFDWKGRLNVNKLLSEQRRENHIMPPRVTRGLETVERLRDKDRIVYTLTFDPTAHCICYSEGDERDKRLNDLSRRLAADGPIESMRTIKDILDNCPEILEGLDEEQLELACAS